MKNGILSAAFIMIATVSLAACGGGGGASGNGGDANMMTVAVFSGPSGTKITTYTEGPYNAQGYLDPSMSSWVTPSGNTYISLCSGVSVSPPCATLVNIVIKGSSPTSYLTGTTGSPTQITYGTNNKMYSSFFSSTIGTITLTSVGVVGEKITGTFDTMVTLFTKSSDTLRISGTFSVGRDY